MSVATAAYSTMSLHAQNDCSLLPNVRNIAVLRANFLGDLVFALPALDALRKAYPDARITLLGKKLHQSFFETRPGPVDEVVLLPPTQGVSEGEEHENNSAELERFFGVMRLRRFDLAIQLHGGGRHSNPFLLQLGARLTAGLKAADAVALDRWVPYVYFQPEVMRYLEVMALVGAAPDSLAPRCPVTATDLEQSYAAVPDEGRLAVVHPGATDPRRRWPAEKFAAVADALIEAGARVLLIGDQSERAVASAVLRHMRGTAADLCGQLSLQALVGVLSRARVVVANDSGPVHLAEAAGAATVGIYWCFNFINGAPLTRTRHRPFIAWQQKCPQCGRDCLTGRCRHECSFVADVQESDVIAAALDLLD